MQPGLLIYAGKSKSLYTTSDPEIVLVEFRDDATAFNAQKKAQLTDKGKTNNLFNAFIMRYLAENGVVNHFIEKISDHQSLMKKLQMIPLESVVRNYTTGGLAKRLGMEEKIKLQSPVYELFYKDDSLGDPLVNESIALAFEWATEKELDQMRRMSLQVNDLLQPLFQKSGFILADFKLEFGRYHGQIVLGDEFTLDGCRIWDSTTFEKFDKDRFRRDLGDVIEHYQIVAQRLGIEDGF